MPFARCLFRMFSAESKAWLCCVLTCFLCADYAESYAKPEFICGTSQYRCGINAKIGCFAGTRLNKFIIIDYNGMWSNDFARFFCQTVVGLISCIWHFKSFWRICPKYLGFTNQVLVRLTGIIAQFFLPFSSINSYIVIS